MKYYGLEEQESLNASSEDVVESMLEKACEHARESFEVVAARIKWPVIVYEFEPFEISEEWKSASAERVLQSLLDDLYEDFGDRNGDGPAMTKERRKASSNFVDEICKGYDVYLCGRTGMEIQFTKERAKDLWK